MSQNLKLVCVGVNANPKYAKAKTNSVLVCVGMGQNLKVKANSNKGKTNSKCFGMRRYESKFISQGKLNKGILGAQIP